MLAMPLATVSVLVLANSQADAANTSRPIASGIHNAPYPHASTRLANAAASAAEQRSSPAQIPSLFKVIAYSGSRMRLSLFYAHLSTPVCPPDTILFSVTSKQVGFDVSRCLAERHTPRPVPDRLNLVCA